MADMKLFAGNATPELAKKIAARLYTRLGNATVDRFSDGEIHVQINENVRGCDIFIIQSTCAPTNDNLMELIVMIDAMRRASAGRITAVVPYFGYARQDRRLRSARVPITAKVVADFLSSVGVDRVLTVDLHAEQIQGFFDVPVDNCFSSQIFVEDMLQQNLTNPVVVSPDMGGVVRARAIAKLLNNADIAIIDKRRPQPNVSEVMHLIGEVKDRDCIIVDDIIDTGGTLCKCADALKERGALHVMAYATHPVLSGKACENLQNSTLDELVVSDSIPSTPQTRAISKIRYLTLAPMLAEAIRRMQRRVDLRYVPGGLRPPPRLGPKPSLIWAHHGATELAQACSVAPCCFGRTSMAQQACVRTSVLADAGRGAVLSADPACTQQGTASGSN